MISFAAEKAKDRHRRQPFHSIRSVTLNFITKAQKCQYFSRFEPHFDA
jgi:hypothetical protein